MKKLSYNLHQHVERAVREEKRKVVKRKRDSQNYQLRLDIVPLHFSVTSDSLLFFT